MARLLALLNKTQNMLEVTGWELRMYYVLVSHWAEKQVDRVT